jgi:hypothetical protein
MDGVTSHIDGHAVAQLLRAGRPRARLPTSLECSTSSCTVALGSAQPPTEMSARGRRARLTTSPPLLRKCCSLDVSQTYRPPRPVLTYPQSHHSLSPILSLSSCFSTLPLSPLPSYRPPARLRHSWPSCSDRSIMWSQHEMDDAGCGPCDRWLSWRRLCPYETSERSGLAADVTDPALRRSRGHHR